MRKPLVLPHTAQCPGQCRCVAMTGACAAPDDFHAA